MDAVGADNWLATDSPQEPLESPLRVGVVRIVDNVQDRIGRPRRVRFDGDEVVLQRILILPLTQDGFGPLHPIHTLGIRGAGHTWRGSGGDQPQLVSLRLFVPNRGTASLQSCLPRLIRLDHGAPLLRLVQRPLEILGLRNRVVIQKQLPLSGGNTARFLGSPDRRQNERHRHCGRERPAERHCWSQQIHLSQLLSLWCR